MNLCKVIQAQEKYTDTTWMYDYGGGGCSKFTRTKKRSDDKKR